VICIYLLVTTGAGLPTSGGPVELIVGMRFLEEHHARRVYIYILYEEKIILSNTMFSQYCKTGTEAPMRLPP
jgi:hypothetical protein